MLGELWPEHPGGSLGALLQEHRPRVIATCGPTGRSEMGEPLEATSMNRDLGRGKGLPTRGTVRNGRGNKQKRGDPFLDPLPQPTTTLISDSNRYVNRHHVVLAYRRSVCFSCQGCVFSVRYGGLTRNSLHSDP